MTFLSRFALSTLLVSIVLHVSQAQEPQTSQTDTSAIPSQSKSPPGPTTVLPALGEGERVAALKASLQSDRQRVAELKATLEKQDHEFDEATKASTDATEAIEAKQKQIQELSNTDTEAAATARDDLVALQKSAELAKDRLDVALQARKTAQEQLLTVDAKIAQDQAALDKLLGSPTPAGGETPKTTEPAGAVTAAPDTAPATDATAPATDGGAPATEVLTKPISEKVAESQERTQEKQEAAEAAREDITELRQRKRTLEQDIELEQQALTAERERQDLLDATLAQQEADYNAKTTAGAAAPELQAIRQLVTETQQQLRETRVSVRKRTDQLQQLRTQLLALQAEEIHLAESAEQKLREAVAAKRSEWLVTLRENTIVRGPKILVAILVMVFLWWLAKALSRRLVRIFSKSGGGQTAERENRAQTLGNVFDNAARVAIVVGGALMVLDIVGIPIGPLLGGAAVMGLAIAFGAQSLIKDYFTGFIVLLENQYKLNDVVTIGGMTGTVERITLRITVLRDFEGRVYFIPNGQVTSVTNHTHEWARAAVDVEIAYQENVDEVIDVLKSLTAELREDEQWKEIILADAEILGVDALRESAVAIRMGIKVLPAKQWALKRELLRRIKNRFDELGIEIPFPQQTVYHRYENEHPAEPFVRPPVQHASE